MKVFDISGKETGTIKLPKQFNEEIRPDLVKKVVVAIQANQRQKYGAFDEAGKRHTVETSKRRRKFRGTYNKGISRTPVKVMSVRGSQFNWTGAVSPNTVGGRRAHPPKASKEWSQKINKKENRKAIRSAISATILPELVKARGHKVPENYPFALDTKVADMEKTKDVIQMLNSLGFQDELKRSEDRKIRPGKGKLRGRKYITKKSLLFVVSDKRCKLAKSAKNVPGVEIVNVTQLNTELLAPGCHMGRATIFTKDAIEKLDKEKLFM